MERGLSTTPRGKEVIEEACAAESARQGGSPPPPPRMQEGGGKAAAAEDAKDVEMTTVSTGDSTTAEPPSKEAEEKAVGANDDATNTSLDDPPSLPPRPPPGRPGCPRHPDEAFLHTVPRSHGGPDKKRAVFRQWPRDPKGKVLESSKHPRGTLSSGGYPWGATLYDVYTVHRSPDLDGVVTIMTGSGLREAMTELGELGVAGPEIEWAMSEGKPTVLGVADTEELIESFERRAQLRDNCTFSMGDDLRRGVSPMRIDREDAVGRASGTGDGSEYAPQNDGGDVGEDKDEDATIPPPTIPVASPFHSSHYPPPWPFIPFADPLSILLQERIPLHLLPQTLHVHDPFDLLPANERGFRDTSWKSRPDIIRTYNLTLAYFARRDAETARRKAEELEEFKARTLIIMRYKRTKEQIKNHEPVIEVPLPPHPRRMTKVEESHLYLSPVGKVGEGHHSIVYKAEWELPRDLLTKPKLCQQCFEEGRDKEIKRLKDTGRWEKMLSAAGWGPAGFTGHQPTQAGSRLDEVNDPTNLERDGEIIEREITCVVPPNASPSQVFEMMERRNVWDGFMKQGYVNPIRLDLEGDEDEDESNTDSDVAIIRIDPPFSYQSQKSCTHGPCRFPIPRTARFTVVAKLSIEYDNHLLMEGRNYQLFPEHFFHHCDGYVVVPQLHSVVPVNAVVPQFYGYYTPENQGRGSYLSPILLLEHCGQPINPAELSEEDQAECASLLLRFQHARWVHDSVAARNFLVQFGKPTQFPLTRECHPEPSFRLIDFGRSKKWDRAEDKRGDDLKLMWMFTKLKINKTIEWW